MFRCNVVTVTDEEKYEDKKIIDHSADEITTDEARELIKLRVLETAPCGAREAASEIAEALGADVVSVIGYRFVLYRRSEKKKDKIVLE